MSTPKPTIGFCGLGAMGYGMATHLLSLSYPVQGYDVFPQPLQRFSSAGGHSCTSLPASASNVSYYIVMVATAAQAQTAIFGSDGKGKDGVLETLDEGAVLVLCSTVPAAYAQGVVRQLKEVGREDVYFIDAPVSGGAVRAADGTLSIMAGASPEAIEKGKFLLEELADPKKLYIVDGGVGQGSNLKMVHQVLAAIQILATSESMGLAARLGCDPTTVAKEVVSSDAWSWMFQNRVARVLTEDFFPGVSALTIILKDVGIITDSARRYNFPTPLCSIAEQVYLTGLSMGFGPHDDAGMVRVYYPEPLSKIQAEMNEPNAAENLEAINKLLRGIHTCAAAEAIAFSKHVGLPLDQMYELCIDAAGGSTMFKECGADMIKWLNGESSILDKSSRRSLDTLVKDMVEAVGAARRVNCPLYLGSGALNLLMMAQQRAPDAGDAAVIKVWAQNP